MPTPMVTLASTTLARRCDHKTTLVKFSSTSGLTPGTCVWVDRELMSVVSLDVDPWVNVKRGIGGSAASAHSPFATVLIGTPDQFFNSDPVGMPDRVTLVSPYVNVLTGDSWIAVGDDEPTGLDSRWWQKQVTTYGTTSLGIRTQITAPPDSTAPGPTTII